MTTRPDPAPRCGRAGTAPWLVAVCLTIAPGWLFAAKPHAPAAAASATAGKPAARHGAKPAGSNASAPAAGNAASAAAARAPEGAASAGPGAAVNGARNGRGSAQAVRVLATRSHAQCPIPGKKLAVMAIDSAQEWSEELLQDEVSTAGRPIRWAREQVLIYAMNQQPTLGVSVEPASRVLTLHSGVLLWPVREIRPGAGQMAATATSRPCLVAIVKRAFWQKIKIVRKH
ncbi:MAG TPA: hypothetical protein PKE61_06410 [Burkholderiaceae bacterium]|nr:hypothetical protein [Burkholderiaceae bacterium]